MSASKLRGSCLLPQVSGHTVSAQDRAWPLRPCAQRAVRLKKRSLHQDLSFTPRPGREASKWPRDLEAALWNPREAVVPQGFAWLSRLTHAWKTLRLSADGKKQRPVTESQEQTVAATAAPSVQNAPTASCACSRSKIVLLSDTSSFVLQDQSTLLLPHLSLSLGFLADFGAPVSTPRSSASTKQISKLEASSPVTVDPLHYEINSYRLAGATIAFC